MEIAFGLVVLALLIWGLRNRKKDEKKWLEEERYEESGAWVDKRSGERGTYGSLDEQRENDRRDLKRQSATGELTRLVQAFCFERYSGYHDLSDAQIKAHLALTKRLANALVAQVEQLANRGTFGGEEPVGPAGEEPLHRELKKKILDFFYERYPALLDQDLALIRKFDLLAGEMAGDVLSSVEQVRKNSDVNL